MEAMCEIDNSWVFDPNPLCIGFAVPAKWMVTATAEGWTRTIGACHTCAGEILADHRVKGSPERAFTFEVLT